MSRTIYKSKSGGLNYAYTSMTTGITPEWLRTVVRVETTYGKQLEKLSNKDSARYKLASNCSNLSLTNRTTE